MKQQTQTNQIEWREVAFGDERYFKILSSGIDEFDKEKDYLSTESIQRTKIEKIECKIDHKNRPSRANMQPILNSIWFAKMKSTIKIYHFSEKNKEEINRYILSTGFAGIKLNKGILPEYVKFFFLTKSFNEEKDKLSTGSTQSGINNSFIAKIKILLPFRNGKPDLEEQQRIVAILEKSERLKEQGKKANELLDEYLKSLFYEMFWNKGFEEVNLGDETLFRIKGGKRLSIGENFSEKITNRPYLRVTDMRNKTIFKDDLRYISEEVFEKIRNYTISSEDVYITIAGTIGLAGIIPNELNGASLTENAAKIVILNKNKVSKLFLAGILSSDYVQNQIKSRIGAVGVPKLALFRIGTIKIPFPPMVLQQKFASIVEKVEKMKENVKKTQVNTEDLFNSLMQKAFRGEL